MGSSEPRGGFSQAETPGLRDFAPTPAKGEELPWVGAGGAPGALAGSSPGPPVSLHAWDGESSQRGRRGTVLSP